MPLPPLVQDHDKLLTLNSNDLPLYKDAVPGIPGVDVQPLVLDIENNVWVVRAVFHPGTRLPTHYHTGSVHLWTLSGQWNYDEYPDQPQTAGSYLYEPGCSVHTFNVPADNTELTETLMVVTGANVNFDDEGNYVGMLDANSITMMIEGLIKERGLDPARYIKPGAAGYTDGR